MNSVFSTRPAANDVHGFVSPTPTSDFETRLRELCERLRDRAEEAGLRLVVEISARPVRVVEMIEAQDRA